jgi:hypothetical protein
MEIYGPLAAPTRMRVILPMMLLAGMAIGAEAKVFTSGPAQTRLIELFTSEGCSSCPPAERWLNQLKDHPGLWRDFVPVAWHVDYWDRLGWPDRFATREFTDRQYLYRAVWAASNVYTPCFALDGGEWRERYRRRPPQPADEQGVLHVEVAGGRCRVSFAPKFDPDLKYEAHAALLGANITTQVQAGENRGETLRHEFVALTTAHSSLRDGAGEFVLPQSAQSGVPRRALAVWITRKGSTEVLQAAGGWLE